jgi:hypothetical protein
MPIRGGKPSFDVPRHVIAILSNQSNLWPAATVMNDRGQSGNRQKPGGEKPPPGSLVNQPPR